MKVVYSVSGLTEESLYYKALVASIQSARRIGIRDIVVVTNDNATLLSRLPVEVICHPSKLHETIMSRYDVPGISSHIFEHSPDVEHVGHFIYIASIYNKLELHEIFPDERIFYTDVDTIFTSNFDWNDLANPQPFLGTFTDYRHKISYILSAGNFVLETKALAGKYHEIKTIVLKAFDYVQSILDGNSLPEEQHMLDLLEEKPLSTVFRTNMGQLPDTYMWRPSFGINPKAAIIHYQSVISSWGCLDSREKLRKEWGKEVFSYYEPIFDDILCVTPRKTRKSHLIKMRM